MVSGGMLGDRFTGELHQGVMDHENLVLNFAEVNAQARFGLGAMFASREIFGEGGLLSFEDAYTKALLFFEEGEHFGAMVHADEDQHGAEGDRGKGIGGHALDFAGFPLYGNHGNAGGEMAEGFPEFVG